MDTRGAQAEGLARHEAGLFTEEQVVEADQGAEGWSVDRKPTIKAWFGLKQVGQSTRQDQIEDGLSRQPVIGQQTLRNAST